jgi:VanZ family protein
MAVLFVGQAWPSVPSPPAGLTDKHEHFFFYGILAVLLLRALSRGDWRRVVAATMFAAVLYSSLYGIAMEFYQRTLPSRSYEILDMIADALGSVLAVGLVWAWGIIRRRFETPDAL